MSTSSDSIPESIGKFAIGLLLTAIGLVLRGYVLATTFNWFVSAPFNAPRLTMLSAIGVSIVVVLFTRDLDEMVKKVKEDDRDFSTKTIDTIAIMFAHLFILGVAWVLHLAV